MEPFLKFLSKITENYFLKKCVVLIVRSLSVSIKINSSQGFKINNLQIGIFRLLDPNPLLTIKFQTNQSQMLLQNLGLKFKL